MISKIGISGKAHAGKDTVAKLIIEQCAKWLRLNEINNYHFADPIKQHLCDILKCDPSMFNDSVLKESVYANNLTYRQLMQNTGDSFKNLLGEDIFVNLAASACMRHELSVIPDVRYINEANWVKSHGVIVQVIDVTGITTVHNTHSSETTEIVPDVILHNDKTKPIELLEEQIRINVLPFLYVRDVIKC